MTQIIVVNGASSSGRTSLVKRFCAISDGSWHGVHIDDFTKQLPRSTWERYADTEQGWVRIGTLFSNHIVELAKRVPRVIADTFYLHPIPQQHLISLAGRESVFCVQLFCSLIELERREIARSDRRIGLARSQFDNVYSLTDYDLRIDSSDKSPDDCAQELLTAWASQRIRKPRIAETTDGSGGVARG